MHFVRFLSRQQWNVVNFRFTWVRDFVFHRRSHLAPKGHYPFIKITYKKTNIFYINKWPLIFLPDRHLSLVCIFLKRIRTFKTASITNRQKGAHLGQVVRKGAATDVQTPNVNAHLRCTTTDIYVKTMQTGQTSTSHLLDAQIYSPFIWLLTILCTDHILDKTVISNGMREHGMTTVTQIYLIGAWNHKLNRDYQGAHLSPIILMALCCFWPNRYKRENNTQRGEKKQCSALRPNTYTELPGLHQTATLQVLWDKLNWIC